nr:immunoglobulin heavy chain junction region [Macaca mulatta]MPN83506.1 immunoglobulin heavy chain junction region [Macaca mulatta]
AAVAPGPYYGLDAW